MDATTALSEGGVNVVLHKVLALANKTLFDTKTWGPFFVSYAASVALSGGVAHLENAPANKLDLTGVHVAGSITASIGFDLEKIIGEICIPPEQICVDVDIGPVRTKICIPRFCLPSLHISRGINLPFAFDFDVSFGFRIDDLGTRWGVVLLVDPFAPRFDLSDMGPAIISAIKAEVAARLSEWPLGELLEGLIDAFIGAFTPLATLIVDAFGLLINAVLSSLDLLNVSIPVTLLAFDKLQTFIPANVPLGGDAPVRLTLSGLDANILDKELVVAGQLA
jgi:hypothetical protein